MEVTALDTYYPDHLNIKNYSEEWSVYAKAVKDIMVKVLDCGEMEVGFR